MAIFNRNLPHRKSGVAMKAASTWITLPSTVCQPNGPSADAFGAGVDCGAGAAAWLAARQGEVGAGQGGLTGFAAVAGLTPAGGCFPGAGTAAVRLVPQLKHVVDPIGFTRPHLRHL